MEQLRAWVDQGGTLLLTGDLSYDEDRQLTRAERLRLLAGVRVGARNYENIRRDAGTDRRAQFTLGPWRLPVPCGPVCSCRGRWRRKCWGGTSKATPVLVRTSCGPGPRVLLH